MSRHARQKSQNAPSTWKPILVLLFICALLVVGTLYGTNHPVGTPTAVGVGVLAVLIISAYRLDL